MTRLLVLGSSHVAALRQAAPAFAEQQPDVQLSFFAAPAPAFRLGRVGSKGFFTPKYRSKGDRQLGRQVNDGALNIDLTVFDKVLVSGFRFSLGDAARLMLEFDLLEGADTGKARRCSRGFAQAVIDQSVEREMKLARNCLGENRNYVLTDAPYPAESIGARIGDYGPAESLVAFMNHPDAPDLFAYWQASVRQAVEAAGYAYLPQPASTVAKPFATQADYTAAAPHFDGSTLGWTDHRHMNAQFGLQVLTAFADHTLTPSPLAA